MKNIILILLFGLFISSCGEVRDPASVYTKKYLVITTNNNNWTNSVVECDSLQMQNLTHIKVYSDGVTTDIFAKRITISSNPYFNNHKN